MQQENDGVFHIKFGPVSKIQKIHGTTHLKPQLLLNQFLKDCHGVYICVTCDVGATGL